MSYKNKPFYFKQFQVEHHHSPMKITTDSLLLGAWAPVSDRIENILDIGTGCGIIAMMLSQRLEHKVNIDAVDISQEAIDECAKNCKNAKLDRIKSICSDILNLPDKKYDLIITNPPYFEPSLECKTEQRTRARQTTDLTFVQLIRTIEHHLTEDGSFCLVLPKSIMAIFDEMMKNVDFSVIEKIYVQHQIEKPISVVLACYKRKFQIENFDQVSIENRLVLRERNGSYTEEAKLLLNNFYLNMDK